MRSAPRNPGRARAAGLLLLAAAALGACATSPTGRSQFMLISPEAAIVESRKAYLSTVGELDRANKLAADPLMAQRIATITGRLVTEAVSLYPATRAWEWSVAIINEDDTVNAWCMAGGRMAAYTGLFEQLRLSDDEFVQIMGHEIAHALNMGIMAAGAATSGNRTSMNRAALAARLALELPNSRVAESEADQIGIELATRAGYDPQAAVTLWQKMEGLSADRPPEFMSTHPAPKNRQAALANRVAEMRRLNPTGRLAAVTPITIIN